MGSEKLEDDHNSVSDNPITNMERVRQAIELANKGKGHERFRRFGIAAGVIWAVVATVFAVQSWATIVQLNEIMNESSLPIDQRRIMANQQLIIDNQQKILIQVEENKAILQSMGGL